MFMERFKTEATACFRKSIAELWEAASAAKEEEDGAHPLHPCLGWGPASLALRTQGASAFALIPWGPQAAPGGADAGFKR